MVVYMVVEKHIETVLAFNGRLFIKRRASCQDKYVTSRFLAAIMFRVEHWRYRAFLLIISAMLSCF